VNLRAIINEVNALRPTLSGDAPTQDLVQLGASLWTLASLSRTLAEEVKELLRSKVGTTPGQYRLVAPGAACQVTVPTPQPLVRKDCDVQDLQARLGADFYRLFDVIVTVTPRADFQDTLPTMPQDKIAVVLGALDITTHKARVAFQTTEGDSQP
jgi:hypothetical protein